MTPLVKNIYHKKTTAMKPTMVGIREDLETLSVRVAVVERYCKRKGWPSDPGQLSIAQVFEIRSLDEWINA